MNRSIIADRFSTAIRYEFRYSAIKECIRTFHETYFQSRDSCRSIQAGGTVLKEIQDVQQMIDFWPTPT